MIQKTSLPVLIEARTSLLLIGVFFASALSAQLSTEALTAECFWAASKAGVVDEVAASLDASQTDMGWKEQTHYNTERMTTHGIRRAAEMREVVKTLSSLGISAEMTRGTVKRQQELGQLKVSLNDFDGCDARIAALEQALSKS